MLLLLSSTQAGGDGDGESSASDACVEGHTRERARARQRESRNYSIETRGQGCARHFCCRGSFASGEIKRQIERERKSWDGVGAYGPVHCRSICDTRSIPDNRSMSHNRSVSNKRSNTANRSISANDAGQYTTVIKTKSINLGHNIQSPPGLGGGAR
jgi:hypothetical protein